MRTILLVNQAPEVLAVFQESCVEGANVFSCTSLDEALNTLSSHRCEALFVDMEILRQAATATGNSYKASLQPFWLQYPSLDIVVMTSQGMLREAVSTVKQGASDYIMYPVIADEIRLVINNLKDSQQVQSELDYLRYQFWGRDAAPFIQTSCPAMNKVFEDVRAVAPTKSTVLLTGETGTGKGVLAGLIHKHSNRRDEPFISVHCGAIPDTLLESELFGHEEGAFTGAIRKKQGRFEVASNGTIFP
ncbi:MAG: sigma-54-dependent Fis family transcriptional regulator, partial [Candidatus Electrothrix sp. AUS4]|nr:sigma-54-dependent Fis family transcriptional regulator [Candidatus Electrothrix sp. AUS4]